MPQEITELLNRLELNLIALGYAEAEFRDMLEPIDAAIMNREVRGTVALLVQFGRLTEDAARIYMKGAR